MGLYRGYMGFRDWGLGFPKIWGYLFGGRYHEDFSVWGGLCWGPPV